MMATVSVDAVYGFKSHLVIIFDRLQCLVTFNAALLSEDGHAASPPQSHSAQRDFVTKCKNGAVQRELTVEDSFVGLAAPFSIVHTSIEVDDNNSSADVLYVVRADGAVHVAEYTATNQHWQRREPFQLPIASGSQVQDATINHKLQSIIWLEQTSDDDRTLRAWRLPSSLRDEEQPFDLLYHVPPVEMWMVGQYIWLAIKSSSTNEDVSHSSTGLLNVICPVDVSASPHVYLWGDRNGLCVRPSLNVKEAEILREYSNIVLRTVIPVQLERNRKRMRSPEPPIAWTPHDGGLLALDAGGRMIRFSVTANGSVKSSRLCTIEYFNLQEIGDLPRIFVMQSFLGLAGDSYTRLYWIHTGKLAVPFLSQLRRERPWLSCGTPTAGCAGTIFGLWSVTGGIRRLKSIPVLQQAEHLARNGHCLFQGYEDATRLCLMWGLYHWAAKYALEALVIWRYNLTEVTEKQPKFCVGERRKLSERTVIIAQLFEDNSCLIWDVEGQTFETSDLKQLESYEIVRPPNPSMEYYNAAILHLVETVLQVSQTPAMMIALLDGVPMAFDMLQDFLQDFVQNQSETRQISASMYSRLQQYNHLNRKLIDTLQGHESLPESQHQISDAPTDEWTTLLKRAVTSEPHLASTIHTLVCSNPCELLHSALHLIDQPDALKSGFKTVKQDVSLKKLLVLPVSHSRGSRAEIEPSSQSDISQGLIFDVICRLLSVEAPDRLIEFAEFVGTVHRVKLFPDIMLKVAHATGAFDVAQAGISTPLSHTTIEVLAGILENLHEFHDALSLLLRGGAWMKGCELVAKAASIITPATHAALFHRLVHKIKAAGKLNEVMPVIFSPPVIPSTIRVDRLICLLGMHEGSDTASSILCDTANTGCQTISVGALRSHLLELL